MVLIFKSFFIKLHFFTNLIKYNSSELIFLNNWDQLRIMFEFFFIEEIKLAQSNFILINILIRILSSLCFHSVFVIIDKLAVLYPKLRIDYIFETLNLCFENARSRILFAIFRFMNGKHQRPILDNACCNDKKVSTTSYCVHLNFFNCLIIIQNWVIERILNFLFVAFDLCFSYFAEVLAISFFNLSVSLI